MSQTKLRSLPYVAKSDVTCEVKEAFQGFNDVSDDRRVAAVFLVELLVSIYSCLFITWRTASSI